MLEGEQYSCEVEFEEMCITKVTWNIPETYVKEGKHFTVSYVTTDGKTGTLNVNGISMTFV